MDAMNPGMTAEPGMEQPQEPAAQGYTVCIQVTPDGKFSVGVENEAAPMGEGMQAEAAETAAFRPAATVKEALTIALEIIKANGQMPSDGGQDDAEFNSGLASRGAM